MEVVITGTVLENKELKVWPFVWLILYGDKQKMGKKKGGFLFNICNQI